MEQSGGKKNHVAYCAYYVTQVSKPWLCWVWTYKSSGMLQYVSW